MNEEAKTFLEALMVQSKPSKDMSYCVYYKEDLTITAISPVEDDSLKMPYASFPFSEIKDFIEDRKSTSKYILEQDKTDPTKFQIVPRRVEIEFLRTLDNFLTEVTKSKKAQLQIEVGKSWVRVSLDKTLRRTILKSQNIFDKNHVHIKGISNINLYFTAKDDPTMLIYPLQIQVVDLLLQDEVVVQCINDLRSCSVFTKKLFDSYSVRILK